MFPGTAGRELATGREHEEMETGRGSKGERDRDGEAGGGEGEAEMGKDWLVFSVSCMTILYLNLQITDG